MKPEDVDKVRLALAEWRGADALVWLYHASHRQFTLRLHRGGARGNLHVILFGCSFFSAPSQWREADLAFDGVPTEEPFPEYVISDASAKFVVRCTHATIERDVEPVY